MEKTYEVHTGKQTQEKSHTVEKHKQKRKQTEKIHTKKYTQGSKHTQKKHTLRNNTQKKVHTEKTDEIHTGKHRINHTQ